MIASIKAATGLDTIGGMIEMRCFHEDLEREKMAAKHSTLPAAIVMFAIGLTLAGCTIAVNL